MKGKMKKKPIGFRLVAFILAFAMVFTSVSFSDAGSIEAKAAEADGWYWGSDGALYIKDGSITQENFYDAIVLKSNLTDRILSVQYDTTSHKTSGWTTDLWTLKGNYLDSSDTSPISLTNETTYHSAICYGSASWWTSSFTVKHYYSPEISVSGLDDDATYEVTLNGVAYNASAAPKAYPGNNNATLYVAPKEGYSAIVTYGSDTLTLTDNAVTFTVSNSTSAIVIEYKATSVPTATVDLEIIGNGSVEGIANGGKYDLNEDITVTAKPAGNYYVEKITVGDKEQSLNSVNGGERSYSTTISFTNATTYDVQVVFAEKKLAVKTGDIEVEFNSKKTVKTQLNALEKEIFDNVVDSGNSDPEEASDHPLTYNSDNIKYYYWAEVDSSKSDILATLEKYSVNVDALAKWIEVGTENPTNSISVYIGTIDVPLLTFGANGVSTTDTDVTELVKVEWTGDSKYPAVSTNTDGTTVKLVEARKAANIYYTKPAEFEFDSENDIIAAVLGAATTDSSSEITATRVTENLPTSGQSATLTYKLSVAEDEDYLANSITVEVDVKAKINPAIVNITVNGTGTVAVDDLFASGNLVAGTYDIVATPGTATGYVASITVNGVEILNDESEYVNSIFSGSITIENEKTYNVIVTFDERSLVLTNGEVGINGYYEARFNKEAFATLRADVLTAAGLSTGDYAVAANIRGTYYNIDELSDNEAGLLLAAIESLPETREFQITLNASENGQLPAITKTVQITLKESREAVVISQADAYKEVTLDEMPTDLTGWYTVVDPSGAAITSGVTAALNPTELPAEGTKKAEYTLSVSVNPTAAYLGATAEYKVLITNPQYDAKINVTQPTGAEIKIYSDAEHTTLVDTSKLVPAGTYYVTVAPTADDVYVVGLSGLGASNASWNPEGHVYSGEITIEYGAKASNVYDISAVVGTRQIILKDNISKVVYTDDEAELLKGVYTAAVNENATAGISYSNVTVALKTGETLTKNAENTFVITWAASENGQYPEVSTEAKVYISETRIPADINVSDVKVEGEGILMITAEEVNEDGTLKDETKAAILDAISNIVVSDGAAELVLSVDTWPSAPVQAGNTEVTVKVSVAENNRYLANEATFTLKLFGDVTDANVTIADVENGTVTISQADVAVATDAVSYKAGTYTATLTPAKDYFVDTLVVTLDGEKVAEYTYDQFTNGQVDFEVKNGAGEALGYAPEYVLTAAFINPEIVIQDKTVTYYGQPAVDLPELIWNEVYVSTNPADLTDGALIDKDPLTTTPAVNDLTVYYLAREAATFKETVTVNLPIVGNQTFTVDIPVGDQWLEISQEVPVGSGMPTQDELQGMVDKLLEKYSWSELLEMGTDGLKAVAKEEMAGVYEEYYRFYNAHSFGMSDDGFETVKAVYVSDRFGAVESNTAEITLDDDRAVTEIKLNEGVEMTYGFTEAELTVAIFDGVYTDAGKVDGAQIQYITKVAGLNASEEAYTIKVLYAGDEEHKHATAETTIIVNKAPVDVQVDNRLIKWEENLSYDMPVTTTPAGVDTINFIVGLDVSDINIDDNTIKGINGEVQLMIPEELQSILAGVGIKDGVDMSISELQEKLLAAADALGFINSENEIINTLINMLESLPTETADITVKIGGELPTDIGVYLVGAVSADGNYETNFGVGAIVITPDGIKADLDWKVKDENSIITRTLLTSGAYDMGAKVTAVGEGGNIADAEEQVVELFLGVDIDGNIKLETDQTKLNVGAYTEVAMVANWGNQMYYSDPIVRAFLVIAETLDVTFIDETGAENAERFYTFDNTGKTMDVKVAYKDGGEVILNTAENFVADGHSKDNLKIYYVGAQTNVSPYLSTEPPVNAGAYTVTAVYTLRDADNMVSHVGLNVGAMVIEPADSDTSVANGYYKYDKDTSHKVNALVTATSAVEGITPVTTVISAGVTTDGTLSENVTNGNAFASVVGKVNVDMPTWLDELFVKYNLFEAGYTETGISAATFLVYLEKAEAILADLNIELDTITQLKETVAQMPSTTTLTFLDDVAYTNVGAYLVVSVVTDFNHYPSVGAGLMVIYPDATEVDLAFTEKDWNENGIYTWNHIQSMDLGADAYNKGTTEVNADADALVDVIFLGITDDGQILLTDDKEVLDIGAYTEFAYIADLGSTMYYAKPISRPLVIVPNIAEITFVDAVGENNERHFVYDRQQHAMDAVVTVDGAVVENPGEDLTITYTGVMSNGKTYNSTEAPSHTGAYAVTAIYTAKDDQGRRVTAGMAVGAMVIEPAKATIEVDEVAHAYDGNPYDTVGMITTTSTAGETDLGKTIITAELATDGSFSENGLGAIKGAANVDFPAFLDEVLVKIPALSAGYNGTGLKAADFIAILEGYEEELTAISMTEDIYNGLMAILEQLPQNATLTFKEQAEVAPTAVGTYLVIGIVTDANHYPAMDAGMLVIYPNFIKADLAWAMVDTNNVYTEDTLDVLDFSANALVDGAVNADATKLVAEVFLGVDAENWQIVLTDDKADLEIGVYTEMAFMVPEANSNAYYAVPISRPVVVVPAVYTVDFFDGTAVNNDRLYTFDNTGKDMGEVLVKDTNGNVVDTSKGEVTITYVGNDTTPGFYYSTEKPVHVGVYTVIAKYVENENGNMRVGVGTGVMTIVPADAQINVDSVVAVEGEAYELPINATTTVIGDTPKTLTMIAGVDMDGYAESGVLALDGVVNVDFPEAVDAILVDIIPNYKTTGIGTDSFFAKYDEMTAAIAAAGYDTALLDQVKANLEALNAYNLTFLDTEDALPTTTGVYVVVASVFDPDYVTAVDTAVIAISPKATIADLEFDVPIPGMLNIMPFEMVKDFEFGAHVDHFVSTDSSLNAEDIVVKDVIVGLTTDLTVFVGSSDNKPNELGVYDQVAYVEYDEDLAVAVPILRTFTVVKSTANVEFHDGDDYKPSTPNWLRTFVYDGTGKAMPARLVEFGGNVIEQTPSVWYVGIENDVVFYSSDVAPTEVGAYQAIGYYFDEETNIYSVGLGAMTITPREVTIIVDDQSMTVNDTMPELTYKVEGDSANSTLVVTPSTEADGTVVGEFPITATVAPNANYIVKEVVDGTLTVSKMENSWPEELAIEGWTYGEEANAPTAAAKYGTPVFTYYADADCTESLTDVPTAAGTYYVKATVEANATYTGLESEAVAFTIAKATLTATADDQTKVYGAELPEFTVSYTGFVNGDDETAVTTKAVAATTATAASNVGTYDITVSGAEAANYEFTYVTGTLTVTKATLTATADDQTKAYYEALPELTVSYTGFVNGDDESAVTTKAVVATTATAASNVGTYDITVSGAEAANYEFTYVTGTLTITKAANAWEAPLTMEGWTYGEEPKNPEAIAKFGDTKFEVFTDAECTPESSMGANAPTEAGTYYVKAYVEGTENYEGIEAVKEFTIAKADLTVTVNSAEKVYGDSDPNFSVTIEGRVNDDPIMISRYYREPGDNVGTYRTTVLVAENPNYNITVVDGEFTITKAPLMVVANDAFVMCGDEMPEFTISYYGLTNGDSEDVLSAPAVVTVDPAANTAEPGEYDITVTGGTADNYDVIYVDGKFTVSINQNEWWNVGMTMDRWTYGDEPGEVVADAKYGDATIEYYTNYRGELGAKLDQMPTDAGEYFAVATVEATTQYTGLVSDPILFVIEQRYARVAVDNYEKFYGEPMPEQEDYEIFLDGFLPEDEAEFMESLYVYTEADETSPVGEYELSFGMPQYVDYNYNIQYENGWLRVMPVNIQDALNAGIVEIGTIADQLYSGEPKEPTITVKDLISGDDLVVMVDTPDGPQGDYHIGYHNNIDAGTAYAELNFNGNYEGSVELPFTINPAQLPVPYVHIHGEPRTSVEYNGEEVNPWIGIYDEAIDYYLEEGRDFFVLWPDGPYVDAGEYTVTVKAMGGRNYTGEHTVTFTITQAENYWRNGLRINSWNYGEMPQEPQSDARYGEETVTYKFYSDPECKNDVTISNTTPVGEYYVKATVVETDNYTGLEAVVPFTIWTTHFRDFYMEEFDAAYDGTAKKPGVVVYGAEDAEGNPQKLVEGVDYVLEYIDDNNESNVEDLTNVGFKEVIVKGIGNYEGNKVNMGYFVEPCVFDAEMISGVVDKVYTGKEITQDIVVTVGGKVLTEGKDYIVEYLEGTNVNVGTAFMFVSGMGNYDVNEMLAFQITPAKLTDVTLEYSEVEADGNVKNPSVVVKSGKTEVVYGKDYFVNYTNNVLPGEATVTVVGMGNYAGSTISETFKITAPPVVEPVYDLTDATLEYTTVVYNGKAQTPSVTVYAGTIVAEFESDYIVTYENNVNAGTAKVTIKGVGNYKGDVIEKTFKIEKADNTWTKELSIEGWTYGEYDEEVNAPVAAATEGTVSYEYYKVIVDANGIQTVKLDTVPTEKGLYVVRAVVPATDNYKALVSDFVDFNISPKALNDADVKVTGVVDKTYTGEAQIQDDLKVTVAGKTLVEGTDYVLVYENNVEAGTATVIVKAAEGSNYTESIQVTFEIVKEDEVTRIWGAGRYDTAIGIAEELKEERGIDKFDTVIVTTGLNFADALSGSYLSYVKDAPILLINGTYAAKVTSYINSNLSAGGKVYILGGTTAVPEAWVSGIKTSNVKRLGGDTRYETNIEILKEAGVTSGEILVCTGRNFADSISASATKKPIFLVDNKALSDVQKQYLSSLKNDKYYIIGGKEAISADMRNIFKGYGSTSRIGGEDRYETSILLAKAFVTNPESVTIAYAREFPDGLCGGLLAINANGPVILASDSRADLAAKYVAEYDIKNGYVLAGEKRFVDATITTIFGVDEDEIKERYVQ